MYVPQDALLTLPLDEAVQALLEAGRALRGKNLKRGSWLEIARGLRVPRISAILLGRLAAAETRQDALRVLRIARKWARLRAGSGRKRPGKLARQDTRRLVEEHSPEAWEAYLRVLTYDDGLELEMWGNHPVAFQAWQAAQATAHPQADLRLPGVEPATPVQASLSAYAFERKWALDGNPGWIGSRLLPEVYRKLLALAAPGAIQLSPEERAFFERHGLAGLLGAAEDPNAAGRAVLQGGYELAGLILLEEKGLHQHPFEVDWSSLQAWLVEAFSHPPEPDHGAVGAAFYRFCEAAPLAEVQALMGRVEGFCPAWLPALFYPLRRAKDLLPSLKIRPDLKHSPLSRWEDWLASGFGSSLVLHNLRNNLVDLFVRPIQVRSRYQSGLQALLLTASGTTRRMDYPAFTLTCRPSASLVRAETLLELLALAGELQTLHLKLHFYRTGEIGALLAQAAFERQGLKLPPAARRRIAAILERHAIAYVLLIERVFKEEMELAPFRLRRKHIRRFWETLEAGELGELQLPDSTGKPSLGPLVEEFGLDRVKEGLVHALLDHLHDDWELETGREVSLKEACVEVLRRISFTYQYQDPMLPWREELEEVEISPEDLARSQEAADFLIRQFGHTGQALARVLLIPPEAGLPRLNGGQLTALERRYRRVIRAASGASAVDMDAAVLKTYTCRPLSKLAALDRGDLAGDCSSDSVPFRALSPHHTYYGIFDGEIQQRGYMTVYEAWAVLESGEQLPVLCLETINVPIRYFDSVQQDLLLIFEAVARSRGLLPGLVLITDLGTWNYQNGVVLQGCRRFRQGTPVRLLPADPVGWQLYARLMDEAAYYSAFEREEYPTSPGCFRLLAPFDPAVDLVQPENQAEAGRLAALPPRLPQTIARTEAGVAGFISEPPQLL